MLRQAQEAREGESRRQAQAAAAEQQERDKERRRQVEEWRRREREQAQAWQEAVQLEKQREAATQVPSSPSIYTLSGRRLLLPLLLLLPAEHACREPSSAACLWRILH